ncbi:sugar ABC transporter permease [Eisenbergiella tayi]|uniref:Lactose transport system permease protein LacG n=2 Tax=Eisenbergiella tayi TaxID=1432052 RepID=A0A1E3AWT9_9FIRM|nr:multiple sugar transport system permease [Lachnospiraceae bacterium 3_1_57FAA_CT1]ODM05856.1 Lactose transport system permease protein LacG [Eisenbergiella tayi]CUQ09342.1 Inner membrane ABC transporter permease protein ycjP [Fusicatenibacter sp. 2789STDY5834925]SFH50882.1 multiple sugar transport system permease protein/putative aldouronate transport system permease protein [Lachnospiraceae bacterium NLAE-zl-G231]ODM13114.1 Lactose transport system permease protein LacG [Eisenbergiella tayi
MKKSKFRQMSTGDRVFTIVNYSLLMLVLIIELYPLVYVVAASFSDPQAVVSGKVFLFPVNPTLKGYAAVFKNKKILTGFSNSIFYLIVGTVLNLVMTMLCAYPLSRKEFRARGFLSMFFVFTMYFSGGMVPAYILVNKLGMINTRWSMIIPMAMSTYNMIICRTYIVNSIPDELYEASQMDGCTPFRYMLSVVVPLSKPILAVLTLYYGVVRWNDYFNAMLYLYKDNLQPLTIVMKEILIMSQVDMTQVTDASAVSKLQGMSELLKYSTIVVASLPVMLLYPLIQKHLVKGVMIGAVKG